MLSIVAHGSCQCPRLSHDDDEIPSPRYGRVQEVPLQHDVMLRVERNDHAGILAALRFVDRARIGQHQLIHLVNRVGQATAVEIDQ